MDAYWVVSGTIDRHSAWTPSRKQPVLDDLSLLSPEGPSQPIPKQLPQDTPANPVISRTDTRPTVRRDSVPAWHSNPGAHGHTGTRYRTK